MFNLIQAGEKRTPRAYKHTYTFGEFINLLI